MSSDASHRQWVGNDDLGLVTDLYQLTMLQGYWRAEKTQPADFSLFFRELPPHRNYVIAAGLDSVLSCLEALHFTRPHLDYLSTLGQFRDDFLHWLGDLRFTGDVHAVAEGTPVFAHEPLLEVTAPLPEAQVVETLVMNQMHVQSVLATKAARIAHAAGGRPVVDFGQRRIHGVDAALKGARAYAIGGITATSNVLAGQRWGVAVRGTMAHSFVQSYDDELDAFRDFCALYPEAVLLVDTYDTLAGIDKVIALAAELEDDFHVRAVRLDSGNLAELARQSRRKLYEAGLEQVLILASGGLDEYAIARLIEQDAPIDGFGVGTHLGVSMDSPVVDLSYKLVGYAGRGRLKTATGKPVYPGRKQVYRHYDEHGRAMGDVLCRHDESHAGRPLLEPVMQGGQRTATGRRSLSEICEYSRECLARLPESLHALDVAEPGYRVEVSEALREYQNQVSHEVAD